MFYPSTIGGAHGRGSEYLPVEDPATGTHFAACPLSTDRDADAAVRAARDAFGAWSRNEGMRRRLLHRCRDVMVEHTEELAELLTREQGKPLREAQGEVGLAAGWFATVAELPLGGHRLEPALTGLVEVEREPYGVVAAITPWNFPVILAVCKIAPALLAGNTVVVKPSPHAPLCALRMVELLSAVLPPGVLNAVSGTHELGRVLAAHPGVDLVSFTGSVPVGKSIVEGSARDLKRVVLELGGNDAAIVLPDTDPEAVADSIFAAAFANAGQFCVAIKRVYVHRPQMGVMRDALAAHAAAARVGSGLDPDTTMGPVTTREQMERLMGFVAEAETRGGRVVHGGTPLPGPGHFYPPTLVVDPPDDCALVADEQFGPALPLLGYSDVDEALTRANATRFGLGGSVWGADPDEAARVALRLECGTCWVNQHAVFHPLAPFGGHKWSGLGWENGPAGVAEFLRFKVLHRAAPLTGRPAPHPAAVPATAQ